MQRFALSAVLAVLSASIGQAQTSFGQVTGSVTDDHGAAVSSASVRARNVETNVASDTVTSSDGLYNILSLIPGTYEVVVEKTGFDKAVTTRVAVLTGQTASVDVRLKVGKVTTRSR